MQHQCNKDFAFISEVIVRISYYSKQNKQVFCSLCENAFSVKAKCFYVIFTCILGLFFTTKLILSHFVVALYLQLCLLTPPKVVSIQA